MSDIQTHYANVQTLLLSPYSKNLSLTVFLHKYQNQHSADRVRYFKNIAPIPYYSQSKTSLYAP